MSTDAEHLPELTRRQEQILSLIVRSYTQKPEPVSSKFLVETSDLTYSSATIRNEMAVLEELGYIAAPHTSAGRVPTENGYRYFVRQLLYENDLTSAEQKNITEKLQLLPMATEPWMRFAATALARTSQTASLVTSPQPQTGRFKHLELISIQGRLVLLVLVLQGGTVHQRMLTLDEPVPQPTLTETANHLNRLCEDLTANEVLIKAVQLSGLAREVAELAAELLERANTSQVRVVYRDGLSDVINTFSGSEGAQQAVRVFEERAFLNMVLDEFLGPMSDDVQVVIAGDGKWDELSQLSMVLSRYGVPGKLSGAVGVLGPTHINYGRAISTVRYISTLMTNMLIDLYKSADGEETDPTTIITPET